MKALVLTETELREIVVVDQAAVESIENAFTWLAQGKVSMPPIMHIEVKEHQGDVDIKSAYVEGLDQFTICDLSGTGVQDTAIANLALQQAAKKGMGIEIEIKRG